MTIGRSRQKRVNVFLDGKFAFSLLSEVALEESLHTGQELSAGQVEALAKSDSYRRCLNAAVRYLGYRPRSEAEISRRLQQRGYDNDCTERAIATLKEQGLIDDTAFARYWKDNRESFSPRSRRLTRLELQRKGLEGEIIEQAVSDVVDDDSAYRAAVNKARRLPLDDYQVFRRRLGEYLRRRGFGYETIKNTIEKIWQECGTGPAQH